MAHTKILLRQDVDDLGARILFVGPIVCKAWEPILRNSAPRTESWEPQRVIWR